MASRFGPSRWLLAAVEFRVQPDAGVRPVFVRGCAREAEYFRGLLDGQAGEVAEFDQLAGLRFLGGQCGQGVVEEQQFVRRRLRNQVLAIEVHSLPASAAPLLATFVTGAVDENPPHGLGGGGKEVAPSVPLDARVIPDEPQVRLVDEGGCLERLARLLLGQASRR